MIEVKEYYLKMELQTDGIEAFYKILNKIIPKKMYILKKYFLDRCLHVLEIENKNEIVKKNFIAILEIHEDKNIFTEIEKYYNLITDRKLGCLVEEIFANYTVDLNTCNLIYCAKNPCIIVHHDCETIFVIKKA